MAIVSENNFPTKAGLASSASGYACLGFHKISFELQNVNYCNAAILKFINVYALIVFTLAQLFELQSHRSELSALARRGSGSACRSLWGGFVRWFHQSRPCTARPVAEAEHWPELRCLVAVVSSRSKSVGSTEGMRRSVETSRLLEHRVKNVLPDRVQDMQMVLTAFFLCLLYNF